MGLELEHAEADPLGLIDAVGARGQRTLVHDARADEEEGPLGLGDHLGEIQGRLGEIQGRYRGDTGEM